MRHLFYLTAFLLGFTDTSLATIPLTNTSPVAVHRPSPRHTRHRPAQTISRHFYSIVIARATESSHQPSIRLLRRTQQPSAAMARTVSASLAGVPALVTAE
jgi:hypothetical protein